MCLKAGLSAYTVASSVLIVGIESQAAAKGRDRFVIVMRKEERPAKAHVGAIIERVQVNRTPCSSNARLGAADVDGRAASWEGMTALDL